MEIDAHILEMGMRAREAGRTLAAAGGKQRQKAIALMEEKLLKVKTQLFDVNGREVAEAAKEGLSGPMLKRLEITEKVFNYMVSRIREVAELPDPVGKILEGHTSADGLLVRKISTPIGVIAIIYESRPNVTTDAASVCLKSGNAVILRGGSESLSTNILLAEAMREAIKEAGLPEDAVQIIRRKEHELVSSLLALDKYVDLIIPRGGKGLIRKVAEGTNIPVLKHYDGICHQYIAPDANRKWAVDIVVNSKCQSVEVCNALETLLVDRGIAPEILPVIGNALKEKGVQIIGCPETCALLKDAVPATEEDWSTEYLAPILSIKILAGAEAAAAHINRYGSGHTDGIITESLERARYFVDNVDSASVLVNASTRLSGGGAYGMGAVVGISTDKIHARGPVGPQNLTSYKWVAYGQGHLRG